MRLPSTDGVGIELHDLGGSGRPMLVCHATGFCGMAYRAMAEGLSARFHVHAMDFRGHGDSDAPGNGRFDWSAMADDVLAVAARLTAGDRPLAAFGHSMGGAALLLAELRRPGLLGSAYLFEPIVLPEGAPGAADPNGMSEGAARRRRRFASRAEALWRYAGRPPLDVVQAGALADYVQHGFRDTAEGEVELKCAPEHEAAVFAAAGKPTFSSITDVETPTVVAVGTTEPGWTPASFGPFVAEALPKSQLISLPEVGHFGPLQAPLQIADSILGTIG